MDLFFWENLIMIEQTVWEFTMKRMEKNYLENGRTTLWWKCFDYLIDVDLKINLIFMSSLHIII